ncbi:MAG TPA: polysaccharide ABC transporter ATP-binding protein, partial [Candidatus Saccharimonadales bacterium]|nr:polysaccharide ABC transporter ATP-binding protein [Candidatus Saccharimonadales bacterium]
ISVDNVSKNFVLPHEKVSSVKGLFTNLAKGNSGKTKETQHALKDISFEVKKGEFFGIVGRNGSGKSTMLKMLAGIYQPTKGKVNVRGRLVPFIELGVGFNPELTGRENVYLNGAMMGFSKKQVDDMYDDIVAFAELEQFMDQKLKNYSSGMQVRLAFSVAIKAEADVLLVDEVLAVGDADFKRKCYGYFKSLKKAKKTVVFVTHDMGAIEEYCDRAIQIEDGIKAHEGKPSKIAAEYLKMFNKPETEVAAAKANDDDRWGNQALSITTIKTEVTEKYVVIKLDIKNNGNQDNYDGLHINIDVRDAEQKLVAGNNFRIKNDLQIAKHKHKNITITLDNNFAGGDYTLDIALMASDWITIFDHWNGAAVFSNIVGRSDYFPMVASGKLEIT